jgi:hypothetical protein
MDYFMKENNQSTILAFTVHNTNKLKMLNIKTQVQSILEISNIKQFTRNSKCIVLPNGEVFVSGGINDESGICIQDNFRINISTK